MQDIKILKSKKLEDLRYIAKMMGIKSITKYRKSQLIDLIIAAGDKEDNKEEIKPAQPPIKEAQADNSAEQSALQHTRVQYGVQQR